MFNLKNILKLKKNAQSWQNDDEENIQYQDDDQMENEYDQFGIDTTENVEMDLGFTPEERNEINQNAASSGLDQQEITNMNFMIDSLDKSVREGMMRKVDAFKEIDNYVSQIAQSKPQQSVSPDQSQDIVLEEQLPEDYKPSDDMLNKVYEQTHAVINPDTQFYATKQSEAFEDTFLGDEASAIKDKFFRTQAKSLVKAMRSLANNTDRSMPNLSPDDVMGTLWTNLHNALGVMRRVDPTTGYVEDKTDNRLSLFAKNPGLVPERLRGEWGKLEDQWDGMLENAQAEAVAYNSQIFQKAGVNNLEDYLALYGVENVRQLPPQAPKPKRIPKQMYSNRKAGMISENKELTRGLIEHLNYMINQGLEGEEGQALLDAVFNKAKNQSLYELMGRERDKAKQMGVSKGDEGEELDQSQSVSQEQQEEKTKQRAGRKLTFQDHQQELKRQSDLIGNFMDDVWGNLKASVANNDVRSWENLEKFLLRMNLFKEQARLFSGVDPDDFQELGIKPMSGKKGLQNSIGKLNLKEDKTKTVVINDENGNPVTKEYSVGMKDIISPKAYLNSYLDLLRLKVQILQTYKGLGMNPQNIDIDRIRNTVLSTNSEFSSNNVIKSILSDNDFIENVINQDAQIIQSQYRKIKEDPRSASRFNENINYIWAHLAADSLVAVAKGIKEIRKNPPQTKEEREQVKENFRKARQNFISIISVHATLMTDNAKKRALGVNKKLKDLLGIPVETKDIMQMIAGLRPIPEEWIEILSSHEYKKANTLYNKAMIKIAKLHNIYSNFIKTANTKEELYCLDDKINEIWSDLRNNIKNIMGN